MNDKYFELDDPDTQDRWYLGGAFDHIGIELDPRQFTYGLRFDVGGHLLLKLYNESRIVEVTPPLFVPIHSDGPPLDFTFAEFDMPVVKARIADLIESIAGSDIQRIPVTVELHNERYDIINIGPRVDCIDTERSEIEWWTEADDRPDKLGKPRVITSLKVDPRRAAGHHIFRPTGWEIAIIVSSDIRDAFATEDVSGVTFRPI